MAAPKAARHLTTEELAGRLGVGVTTLRDWRRDNRGPAYIHEGSIIRYPLAEVEAWEKRQLVRTSA